MTDTASQEITVSLSLADWVKIAVFLVGQLGAGAALVWRLASRLQGLESKVDEVIKNQLGEHERRITRLEDKTFPVP